MFKHLKLCVTHSMCDFHWNSASLKIVFDRSIPLYVTSPRESLCIFRTCNAIQWRISLRNLGHRLNSARKEAAEASCISWQSRPHLSTCTCTRASRLCASATEYLPYVQFRNAQRKRVARNPSRAIIWNCFGCCAGYRENSGRAIVIARIINPLA